MQIKVYCRSIYLFVYQTFVYFFLRCIDPAAEIEPDQTYDESDAEGEALGPEDDSGALADPSTLYVLFYFLVVYQIFVYKILFTFFLRYGAPPGDALDEYGNGADYSDYSDYDENDYTVSQRCLQKKGNFFLGGGDFLLNCNQEL